MRGIRSGVGFTMAPRPFLSSHLVHRNCQPPSYLRKDSWPACPPCPAMSGQCLLLQTLVPPNFSGYDIYQAPQMAPIKVPFIRFNVRDGYHLHFGEGRLSPFKKKILLKHPRPVSLHLIILQPPCRQVFFTDFQTPTLNFHLEESVSYFTWISDLYHVQGSRPNSQFNILLWKHVKSYMTNTLKFALKKVDFQLDGTLVREHGL